MPPQRRRWLLGAALSLPGWPVLAPAATPDADPADDNHEVRQGRALVFPRDHGAHLGARTEWWYATGWLGDVATGAPSHGFQVTFFRSATGLAAGNPSRFAARQLLFAHAAVTVLEGGRHLHDQRIARWSGAADAVLGAASVTDGDVRLGRWQLRREGQGWQASVPAQGFSLTLSLQSTQALLLQGDAGFSRKGPLPQQASHYYSQPHLAVQARLATGGAPTALAGRAWLDHEWSQEILHPDAVGWDWIGINLADGSALTAFVLRRADGSALWGAGSWRAAGTDTPTAFGPSEVLFRPVRRWRSPATGADYPVQWDIVTPMGRHAVRALLDAQELDSRASTGTVYWEGLSEMLDEGGRRVGLGYLEMTGYAARLRLG